MNKFQLLFGIAIIFIFSKSIQAQSTFTIKDTAGKNALFKLEFVKNENQEKVKLTRESGNPASVTSTLDFSDIEDFTIFGAGCKVLINNTWGTDIEVPQLSPEFDAQLIKIYESWRAKKIETTLRLLNVDEPAGIIKVFAKRIPLITLKKSQEEIEKTCKAKKDICDSLMDEHKKASTSEKEALNNKINEARREYMEAKQTQEILSNGVCSNNFTQTQLAKLNDGIKYLDLQNVSFTISDNFIYRITVEGEIDGEAVSITNSDWSLSLKSRDGQSMSITIGGETYTFCYKNIFTYESYPPTGAFSYYVKDAEFNLKPGEEKVLRKKSLDEYLGINISSDFLGINTKNSNNLLTTDFNTLLPLNITQRKRIRWFNHASIRLGFTVLNGANGNNEFNNLRKSNDSLFIDVFDLIRFQNINLGLYQSFFGIEAKQINTIFNFALGVDFYRSGLRLVEESPNLDKIQEFQVWSSAPYFKIFAQYRPDLKFGVDFQYAIKRLTLNNLSNDTPAFYLSQGINIGDPFPINPLVKDRIIIHSFELDLYGQPGGKAGVFARIGVDAVGFGFKDNIFPRITVGYSTNLDAYVNSVRKQ